MLPTGLFTLSLLLLASPLLALCNPLNLNTTELSKRQTFANSRWTFYNVGLGTCGQTHADSDFVVALNALQYGTGVDCLKQITMIYNGKSTTATIVDDCPGCPYEGLDLSPGLFEFFAPLDLGAISGTWFFVDN